MAVDEGATCFRDFSQRLQKCALIKDKVQMGLCIADAEVTLAGCIVQNVKGVSKLIATKLARAAVAGLSETLVPKLTGVEEGSGKRTR